MILPDVAVRYLSFVLPEKVLLALLDMLPQSDVQEYAKVNETMVRRSEEIIKEKKAALEKGDQALLQEVGEGKDIISVLSKYESTCFEL